VLAAAPELSGPSFLGAGRALEEYADAVEVATAKWWARKDADADDAEVVDAEEDDAAQGAGTGDTGEGQASTGAAAKAQRLPAATAAVRPVRSAGFGAVAKAVEALEAAATAPSPRTSGRSGVAWGALVRWQGQRARGVERAGRVLRQRVEAHPLEALAFLPRLAALCWQDASSSSAHAPPRPPSLPPRAAVAAAAGTSSLRGSSASSSSSTDVEAATMGDGTSEADSAAPHSAGVCFNWENWGVCARGSGCRFFHDRTLAAPLGAYKGRAERAEALSQHAAGAAANADSGCQAGSEPSLDAAAGAAAPFTLARARIPRSGSTNAGVAHCFVAPALWGGAFQEPLWAAALDAMAALPPSLLLLPVPRSRRAARRAAAFSAPPLPFAAGAMALLLAATARLGATQRALASGREATNAALASLQRSHLADAAAAAAVAAPGGSAAGSAPLGGVGTAGAANAAAAAATAAAALALPSVGALPPLESAAVAAERVVGAAFDLLVACRAERPRATAQLLGRDYASAAFGMPPGAIGHALRSLGVSLETLDATGEGAEAKAVGEALEGDLETILDRYIQ
jgi:hypothetical protein